MTAVRVLGALGKTVIALGLVILLFAIFQLWGTGIFEARAQQNLDNEFTDLLEESSALGPAPFEPGVAAVPSTPATLEPTATAPAATAPIAELAMQESGAASATQGATPSPPPTAAPEPPEEPQPPPTPHPDWLAMLYRDQGSAIARIQIPAIGVDKTVVEGVRVSDLRKGPGHYPATPIPGQAGNAAIAGHRTTYGAPFGNIDELVPGDEIIVTTIQGEFVYQVVEQGEGFGHIIVAPTAVEVLDQDFSDHPNRLTLTACHPKGSARQRIIVVAALVGDPAPTYPRPGQEEPAPPELASESLEEAIDTEQTVTPTPATQPSEPAAPAPGSSEPAAAATQPSEPAAAAPGSTEPDENPTSATAPSEAAPAPAPTPSPTAPAPAAPGPDPTPSPQEDQEDQEAAAGSFGEGLDGDSDGLVPAVLWGLATLAIWFFALFVGKRWRRLPAYALSALPFLVVMFMAFWHIDRVIPSY